jgi:hypothetical protein
MPLDVIGAGFGRTSTKSLKDALELLGFDRCYHMFEVREHHPEHRPLWAAAHRGEAVDWEALFVGYRASVDWPSCNLWRELAQYYPQAKVILTARDAEQWYDSVMRTIYPSSQAMRTDDDPQRREAGEWVNTIIWQQVFDGRMNDRAHAISVYNTHVASVRAGIASERLLVFEPQSGWAPLCEFLQCPLPDTPYPLVNTTEEFLARRHAQVKPAT